MAKVLARTVVVLLAAAGLVGCGRSTGDPNSGAPSTPAEVSASQSVGDAPTPEPAGTGEAAAELPDGRHPGLIKTLDPNALSMTFDLVEFLTGQAAKDAYLKENPTDTMGPPNDYWVVNVNPKLRTLAITSNVVIIITPGGDPTDTQQVTVAQLPGAFNNQLDTALMWLTVSGGKVTKIEQQWLP